MSARSFRRLLRVRVKEWASCLFPCRSFAADQDPAPPQPLRRLRNAAFDGLDDEDDNCKTNSKGGGKKMMRECHDTVDVGGGSDEPHFSEEEYIVFCFRDDGAFDVVAKSSSDSSNVVGRCSSASRASRMRSVSQKGYKEESVTPNGESKTWIYDGRMMSVGSRDSYQSDGSSAESFAFPILRWDWSESPDRMPKKSHRCIRFHCCSSDDREKSLIN